MSLETKPISEPISQPEAVSTARRGVMHGADATKKDPTDSMGSPDMAATAPPHIPQPLDPSDLGMSQRGRFWREHLDFILPLAQVLADFWTVFACYVGSYFFYTALTARESPQPLEFFLMLGAGAGALYTFILDRVGLYRREVSLLNVKELRGIFHTGMIGAAAVLSISFYIRDLSLSRITITMAILATPAALLFQRGFFYRWQLKMHQKGLSRQRVLVYGAGLIGQQLVKRMFESPSLGLFPVGFLDDDTRKHGTYVRWKGPGPRQGVPVLGGQEFLARAKDYGVDSVLIALPSASFERNQRLVDVCVAGGVQYSIVPHGYNQFIQQVEMLDIGGIPILRRKVARDQLVYRVVKRAVDFALATFFILALSPMYILFWLLIKLDSPGPVIFKQRRTGLRGREFSIYKFRTMYVDAPKYAETPHSHVDPRITKVGRWLRRTSLDELPQLFNVFRGDMSLVGPRPELPFIVDQYTPLQRLRLDAKPGLTGVWQISAVRGEPIHANIEYDLFYLDNRSLLLDLSIIVKTIVSVVRGVGAV